VTVDRVREDGSANRRALPNPCHFCRLATAKPHPVEGPQVRPTSTSAHRALAGWGAEVPLVVRRLLDELVVLVTRHHPSKKQLQLDFGQHRAQIDETCARVFM